MKEGKHPKPMFCDFLGFLVFFQLLVAVSAVARVFGWVLMAHFAERILPFPPMFLYQRLSQVDVPLSLRISTQLSSLAALVTCLHKFNGSKLGGTC
jgi:hypothetical protein